jgi:uncharacterized protein YegP (UPF0339 family)
MTEFSRRVNVEVFKDEPKSRDEWASSATVTAGQLLDIDTSDPGAAIDKLYREYLDAFQPYWWHAQSPNGEILTNGEHYAELSGATNSIEVLFGDDTTMYWAPMFGEDRGEQLLRYGVTDLAHQSGAHADEAHDGEQA